MNKFTFLLTGLVLAFSAQLNAQTNYTLDLGSSFSPAWVAASTSGTTSGIGASGITCTMNFTLTGGGTIVSPYPRVNNNNSNSSDFVVQGSSDAMELDVNLNSKTSYVDISYTFSAPVQNVSFAIADIDMPGGSSPYAYVDQVTVSGSGPAGAVTPTLTKYNTASTVFNIAGNVATGNTGTGGSNVSSLTLNSAAQDGTMMVNFGGNAVTTITIRYGTLNSALVSTNPGLQAIAMGNIVFQKAVAPVAAAINVPSMVNTNAATAIPALSASDDESIASYTIKTLPPATSGILSYNNGTSNIAISANQVLTPAQAATLKFDPLVTYTGNAVFTFTATDNRGVESSAANYSIQVVSSLLPVTLTDFSGVHNNQENRLSWTTQQEINAASFILEKSADGNSWQVVTSIAATGNSNCTHKYTAVDKQAVNAAYYRLKQIDNNGSYVYSRMIKMDGNATGNISLRLYPNPVVNNASVTLQSGQCQTVTVMIFNSNGTMLRSFNKQVGNGSSSFNLPGAKELTNGMYTLKVATHTNEAAAVLQFVKQ